MILDGGRISIHTDEITFKPEFEYGDNEDFLKVFVFSYVKLLSDSPLVPTCGDKPVKVYTHFLRKLISERISDTIKFYSSLADQIMFSTYETGSELSTTGEFVDAMKHTPVFKEYLAWYRTGNPVLLRYLLTFLRYGKKLRYNDPKLDSTAFHGWEQVEERLRGLEFNTTDLDSLRVIVSKLVGPLSPDQFLGRFGPGKVSEADISDSIDKLVSLSTDRKLDYVFGRSRPSAHEDQGFGTLRAIRERGHSICVSRLKFVPKDITKSRSICMEPNAYMYFQQEVLRWMRAAMQKSTISRFVNLANQSINRDAALHGSIYLSSDTLDLSSASDSVHIDLVRGIFPTSWLFYMLGTRTSQVRTSSGEIVRVSKFAPMGSAVCFPTQCIVFTAICLYAYDAYLHGCTTGDRIVSDSDVDELLAHGIARNRSENTPFRKRLEPPVVYGDDIIVDSRVTDIVISTLERLGFQVNVAKSFAGSQSIRESCGIYAFKGEDVTPRQFLLPFLKKGRWDAKVYASLIGAVNEHRKSKLYNVAAYLNSLLNEYGFSNPIPYVEDENSFGVLVSKKKPVPGKYVRYNANIQVYEELVQGIGPRNVNKKTYDDVYRYDQWWRSRIGGDSVLEERGRPSIRPKETRLVPLWARYES